MANYYYVESVAAYGGAATIDIDGTTYTLTDDATLWLFDGDTVRVAGDDALSPRVSTSQFGVDGASIDRAQVDIFIERTTQSGDIDFTDSSAGQLKPTIRVEDGTNAPTKYFDLRSAEDAEMHVGSEGGSGASIGDIDGGLASDYDDVIFVHANSRTGTIETFSGDDSVILGDNVTVDGGVFLSYGNDTLIAGDNVSFWGDINGYYGNDTIILGDNNAIWTDSTLHGWAGDDTIRIGENFLSGGSGSDIEAGSGDDLIILRSWNYGGTGDEIIDGGTGTDTVKFHVPGTGNEGTFSTWMTTNGFGSYVYAPNQIGFFDSIFPATLDAGDDGYGGTFNPDLQFKNTENIVICFAGDSAILTPGGPRRADALKVGDLVITRDNGPQAIRWIGTRTLDHDTLRQTPHLRPICFAAGSLGPGVPTKALTVSRQHRMVVRSPIVARMCGASEALVPACKLLDLPGVTEVLPAHGVTYVHLLFDRHEIVWANDAEAESLFTGPEALKAIGPDARREILTLFPHLRQPLPARPLLTGRRALHLARRHRKNAKALQAG